MKSETKLWLAIANEDFKNIKAMLKTKSSRAAVFFAQQSVEKILKAYIVEYTNKKPKKTHRIEALIKEAGLKIEEVANLPAEELSRAYVWVRYPDLSKRFYTKKDVTEKLIVTAQKLYQWVKSKFRNS